MHSLLSHLSPEDRAFHLSRAVAQGESAPDPLGALQAVTAHVFDNPWEAKVAKKHKAQSLWCCLRHKGALILDGSANDLFVFLEASTNVRLWQLAAAEVQGLRHPITGDTLLHCAARVRFAPGMRACMRRWTNPFVVNAAGETAASLLEEGDAVEMQRELRKYSEFDPQRPMTADWFGPYFVDRARAFLSVCNRWAATGERHVARDVRMLIVKEIARCETVWYRPVRQ